MNTDIKTRAYGISEIYALGWRVFWSKFGTILIIVLCVYVPIGIVGLLLSSDTVTSLLDFFVGVIATLATAYVVEQTVLEQKITWREALRHAASRWISAIGTGIVAGIILTLLSLLFVIPGVIWGVYYTFYLYVVALRNTGSKSALDYSKNLVKGRWWSVFGTLLAIVLPGVVVMLLVVAPLWLVSVDGVFPESSAAVYAILLYSMVSPLIILLVSTFIEVTKIVWFLNLDYLANPVPAAPSPSLAQSTLGAAAGADQ